MNGRLSIVVRSYDPHVTCASSPPFPALGPCARLLSTMPITQHLINFQRSSTDTTKSGIPPGGRKLHDRKSRQLLEDSYAAKVFSIGFFCILLIKRRRIASETCFVTVDLVPGADTEIGSWWTLWAGAVAVQELCVKYGNWGYSSGHGASLYFHLIPSMLAPSARLQ